MLRVWRWIRVVLLAGLAAGVLGLAMLGHREPSSPLRTMGSVPDQGLLPDFALLDEYGTPFTRQRLEGRVTIAGFIFTRCAGQCPLITAAMAQLGTEFPQASVMRLLAFSVDPAYDTPEVLRAYAKRLNADPRRWSFVTGDPEVMNRLVRQGFRLSLGPGASPREPIAHSVRLALIDPRGHLRGTYDTTDAEAMSRLRQHVRTLLLEAASL